MYQYENKPKKKAQNYTQRAYRNTCPCGVGGQTVGVRSALITMGDNDHTFGHNCILIEKLEPNTSPHRYHPYELKRTCFVAHLVPETPESYNLFQKIAGVPGIVKHEMREEYYMSDKDLSEGRFLDSPNRDKRPQDYFNKNYRKQISFKITPSDANNAINKARNDEGCVTSDGWEADRNLMLIIALPGQRRS